MATRSTNTEKIHALVTKVGRRVVFDRPATGADLSKIEEALKVVLPEAYKEFMMKYGPFGVQEVEEDGFESFWFRMFRPDEVIFHTQRVRKNYPGIVHPSDKRADELKELLSTSVFFMFTMRPDVENFFGFDSRGRIRRLDHDEIDLVLEIVAQDLAKLLKIHAKAMSEWVQKLEA